jgi:hypothetical protein
MADEPERKVTEAGEPDIAIRLADDSAVLLDLESKIARLSFSIPVSQAERLGLQLLGLVALTRPPSPPLTDREILEQTPPLAAGTHPRFGFGARDDGHVIFWIAIERWRPFLFMLDGEEADRLIDGLRDARQAVARQSQKPS